MLPGQENIMQINNEKILNIILIIVGLSILVLFIRTFKSKKIEIYFILQFAIILIFFLQIKTLDLGIFGSMKYIKFDDGIIEIYNKNYLYITILLIFSGLLAIFDFIHNIKLK